MAGTLLLLIALSITSSRADGTTFSNPAWQFSLDPGLDGARPCVAVPVELTDPSACEGLDVDQVRSKAPAGIWLFSTLPVDEGYLSLVIDAVPGAMSKPWTLAHVDEFARSATTTLESEGGTAVGGADGQIVQPLIVNDLQVLRMVSRVPNGAGQHLRTVGYTVLGRQGMVHLAFIGVDVADDRQDAVAARLMQSIRMPPIEVPARWAPQATTPFETGERMGRLMASLACASIAFGTLVWAVISALRGILSSSRTAPP